MAYPDSTVLVPELQKYFSSFIIDSILNKNQTTFPSDINITYEDHSFIRMLFDSSYPYSDYRYLYRLVPNTQWPNDVSRRLSIFPASGKYYSCDFDTTSMCNINIFQLKDDDILLLNKLLEYRQDSTSTTLIGIIYNDLTTNLSKLIYIYLDLKINQSIQYYDNTTLISDSTKPLECLYENLVIEEVFNYISSKVAIEEQPS